MGRDEEELLIEGLSREAVRGIMWEAGWEDADAITLDALMKAITDMSRAGILFGRTAAFDPEPVKMEVSPDLTSTICVSFAKGELGHIEAAAQRDGKTLHRWCRDVLTSVAQLTSRSDA